MRVFVIFLQIFVLYCTAGQCKSNKRGSKAYNATKIVENLTANKTIKDLLKLQSTKNPNFVRDRLKNVTDKPELLEVAMKDRYKKPYHPAWQDYCDPYHCNDYHKTACGLHRKNLRFQWFQSTCHLILNNQCATYRGALKYDLVANKYCQVYVMDLRSSCTDCDDDDDADDNPVCAVSSSTSRVLLFKNRCTMDKVNCEKRNTDYEEVSMILCEFYQKYLVM